MNLQRLRYFFKTFLLIFSAYLASSAQQETLTQHQRIDQISKNLSSFSLNKGSLLDQKVEELKSDFDNLPIAVQNYVCRQKCYHTCNPLQSRAWQFGIMQQEFVPEIYRAGTLHNINVEDNITLESIAHFRQNSDTLIVVAGGLGSCQEYFTPALWFFQNADVVTFDFRGQGMAARDSYGENELVKTAFLEMIPSLITFGKDETKDLLAVVNYYTSQKKYKKIVGFGFCFGAAVIVKAQVESNDTLFTHLILDSLWPSLDELIQRFIRNPGLLIWPVSGSQSKLKYIFQFKIAQKIGMFILRNFIFDKAKNFKLNICELLPKIHVPTALLYGLGDELTTKDLFAKVHLAANKENTFTFTTGSRHTLGFLDNRFSYKIVVNALLDCGIKELRRLSTEKCCDTSSK